MQTLMPVPSCSGKLHCTAAPCRLASRLSRTHPLHRQRVTIARASGESDAGAGVAMTLEQAQDLLRVKSTDSFETIMAAKNKQLARAEGDQAKIFMIEAAYDLLLMQSMKQRLTGEMKVSNSVRFADVPVKKTVKQVQTSMLSQLPNGGVRFSTPQNDQILVQSGVFAFLLLWSFVQAVTEPQAAQLNDVAGLQQSLGFIASVYFFREKKRLSIGRSLAYALGGLVLGSVVGGALQSWLRVDIVPVLGLGSPGVFTAEFGLLGIWAATLLLA